MAHRSGLAPAAPDTDAPNLRPSGGGVRRGVEVPGVILERGPGSVRMVIPPERLATLALEVTSLANRTTDAVGIRVQGRTRLRLTRDGIETSLDAEPAAWQAFEVYAFEVLSTFLVQAALGFSPVDHVDLSLLSGGTFTVSTAR